MAVGRCQACVHQEAGAGSPSGHGR
jgi:hypothetical protein